MQSSSYIYWILIYVNLKYLIKIEKGSKNFGLKANTYDILPIVSLTEMLVSGRQSSCLMYCSSRITIVICTTVNPCMYAYGNGGYSSHYCCINTLPPNWVACNNHSVMLIRLTDSIGQDFRQGTLGMGCWWCLGL